MNLSRLRALLLPRGLSALKPFAGSLLFCLASTVLLMVSLESRYEERLVPWVLAAGLGALLFVPAALLARRVGSRLTPLAWYAAAAAVVVVYRLTLDTATGDHITPALRHGLLSLAVMALTAALLAPRTAGPAALGRALVLVTRRALTAGFFSVLLFGGISLALYALQLLFKIDVSPKLYGHLWIFCGTLYAPALFLAAFPTDGEIADEQPDQPTSILVRGILVPLAATYLAILYAYIVFILLRMELPKGLVGTLTISFTFLALLAHMLVYPWRDENRYYKLLTRWCFPALVPVWILLVVAIGVRVAEHGITEPRYLVLVAAAWIAATVGYGLHTKRWYSAFAAWAMAAMVLVAAVGPLSFAPVSAASQRARLVGILEKAGLLTNRKLDPKGKPGLTGQARLDAADVIEWLQRRNALPALASRIDLPPADLDGTGLRAALALDTTASGPKTAQLTCTADEPRALSTEGYAHLFRIAWTQYPRNEGPKTLGDGDGWQVRWAGGAAPLVIRHRGKPVLEWDARAVLRNWLGRNTGRQHRTLSVDEARFTLNAGRYRAVIFLEVATYYEERGAGKNLGRIERLDATVLVGQVRE